MMAPPIPLDLLAIKRYLKSFREDVLREVSEVMCILQALPTEYQLPSQGARQNM